MMDLFCSLQVAVVHKKAFIVNARGLFLLRIGFF